MKMASKRVKIFPGELSRLQNKFLTWRESKKCSKYVELCYNIGSIHWFNSVDAPNETWSGSLNAALEILQIGVDIAQEIKYKMSYEQMTDYGYLLYWNEIHNGNEETRRKPLEWFLNCEKTAKNLKEKKLKESRICTLQVFLGLSHFLCHEYSQASEYFIKGFKYKIKNLCPEMLDEFLKKGAECMKILKKPKAYLMIMAEEIFVENDVKK